jgi:hypothetical protein
MNADGLTLTQFFEILVICFIVSKAVSFLAKEFYE